MEGGGGETKLYTSVFGRMVGCRVRTASTWAKTTSGWAYGCMFWRSHLCVRDSGLLIAGDNERKAVRARFGAVSAHRRPCGRCRAIGPGATPSHWQRQDARLRAGAAAAGTSAHRAEAGSGTLGLERGWERTPKTAWEYQTIRTLGSQLPTTDGGELPRIGAQISFPCECDLPWRVAGARLLTASTFPAIKSHGPPQSRPLLDWRWDNRHHPGGAAQASLVRMACRGGRVGLELEQVPTNHDDRSFLGRLKGDR